MRKLILLIIAVILYADHAVSQNLQVMGIATVSVDSISMTLKSDEIVSARTSNVVNAIAGKVAGVQVQQTSSDPGVSGFVIVRGYSSVSADNQPLYVIDGVPLQNTISVFGGKNISLGGISNVSPEDIESMTILKGAAASVLYGSRAANGVILITTKSGKKGQGYNYTIRYSGGMQFPAVKDGAGDFFETGVSHNHAVSLSGVSDDSRLTYYLSYTLDDEDGVFPEDHDTYNRNTIACRGTFQATEWLKLSSSMNLARFRSDIVSFRNDSDCRNDSKQLFGKIQVDASPLEDLLLTYRMGFDYTDYDRKGGEPEAQIRDYYGFPASIINRNESLFTDYGRVYETNHDFMANYGGKYLDGRFDFNVLVGMNLNERASTVLSARNKSLSNATSDNTHTESQWKRRLTGLYADVSVCWDDLLFLELTARNDWLLALPSNSNSFFYPGVSLSYLFSNMFDFDDVLSMGKLRIAYGKTGNESVVYQSSGSLGPDVTTEFEVGANLEFLNGRIGLDETYYNRSSDAYIGTVRNQGLELSLNATPVLTRDFRWDISLNFSCNYNKVESLSQGSDAGKYLINSFTSGSHAVYTYAEEGKPLGQFYTYLPTYTPDGKIIVGNDGLPVLSKDVLDTGKGMLSDWTGGISTSVSYKGFCLSAVFDIRYGGYMFSRTNFLKDFTGEGIANTYNDRKPFIIPNSVVEVSDGVYAPNETPVYLQDGSYLDYFEVYGAGMGGESYLIDRSFTKLRNVSLTYSFPENMVRPLYLSGLSMTAYCNNPFVWTAKTNRFIDPDNTSYPDCGDLASQFGELYYGPACRTFGFNINITF